MPFDSFARDPTDLKLLQHELRTPLNAVLGFSQLIKATQRSELPGRVLHWVDQIEFAGQHMLQLIDTLAGGAGCADTPADARPRCDLLRAVQGAVRMMRLAALHAGTQISLCTDVDRPILVHGDETAHRQVLINLLANAIKYSASGSRVRMEIERMAPGDTEVEVRVRDQGIGMSAEQLARLFLPYERLGREAGSAPGSGLGLYLSKQLVDGLGGRMAIASAPVAGTTVTLHLPLVAAPALPA